MGTFLLTKLFVFAFIFAILYLVREGFRFFRGLNTGEYEPKRLTPLWAGVSIAYILTMLITGFII